MTSRARRRARCSEEAAAGGGGGGGGGPRTCDFGVALERGAQLGWGGPEGTLRGPAALSVPPGRPRPSPSLPGGRVGEVPPAPHSLVSRGLSGVGGRHLPYRRPWAWPSLVWAAGPRLAPRAADVVAQAAAGADLLDACLSPALGPSVPSRPAGVSGPRGPFVTPTPAVRSQPIAWDGLTLMGVEVPPPCFLLSVWVGL